MMSEVRDEFLPEESSEEDFSCTASKFSFPVSVDHVQKPFLKRLGYAVEEDETMQCEDVSGADVKDARCGGQIVSKRGGEVGTDLLSGGSEREAAVGEKISEALETGERRNAVERIADIGGRMTVVRKKNVSGKNVVAGKKVLPGKKVVASKEAATVLGSNIKAATGKISEDPKPVESGKRKLAKKVVGKLEVCSVCEFKGVLESKGFKAHLLKHYGNDLREEFAEALTKKECPFSDHFKSDSRDGSHCNDAMLRHIGVTHGKVVKYHLLQAEKIRANPQLKCGAEARHPQLEEVNLEVCSVCDFEGVLESKTFKRHLLLHFRGDLRKEFTEALNKNHCHLCSNFKSNSKKGNKDKMVRHIGVYHGEVVKYHLQKKMG